jgi:HK97 family phage major capsid protein
MRTQQQVQADIATKSRRIDELFALADSRDDKANTTEELTEIKTLSGEVTALETESAEVKSVDDIKESNKKRVEGFKEPTNRMVHPNSDPTKAVVEFPYVTNLKHFTGATKQEAMTKAYRFGQWFMGAVMHEAMPTKSMFVKAQQWCKANGIPIETTTEIKAASEGVDADGGALVPPEFDNTIIDLKEKFGTFRPNSKVVPMARETKTVPRRTGGLTAYFVGEGATITDSTKQWDNVNLVAKKMAALAIFSSELQEDAIINIADDLAFEIAYAFANKEDECGFNGDGTSTYGGITGVIQKLLGLSSTIGDIAGLVVGTGNTYVELTLADFNAVVGRLPQYADTANAKWFMHKTFYHQVAEKLALAAGGVTSSEVSAGMRTFRFLGYPVQFAQVLPKAEANSQVCALLGDLALASKFGDRRQTTVFLDPYSKTATDQLQIRGTQRIDINVHDVGNASATASARQAGPVVGLITAAS